jgi:pimeloyl-ACP methyl ester carboxylesterase
MATFVIVHGGFGGGWEWAEVARELRAQGHEVFTPTLTGMGERWHLGPEVGLSVHVKDVMAVLEFEDLHRVVLCAASYGGMPVTAAADQSAQRIALLTYIDALVPRDGQSALDLLPEAFGEMIRAKADAHGHGWVDVPESVLPPTGLIPEDKRARYVARLRPQPVATFTEPVQLTDTIDTIPRAFVRCTVEGLDIGGDPIAPIAARARAENWLYREVRAPHDPHLFDPCGTAELLHELSITIDRVPVSSKAP